jgi:xanthine dehydrogenase accessory factor
MELLRHALSRIEAGDALALVTVIRVSGSVPRHVGARMLVDGEGRSIGTIGGGRVELETTRAAVDVARGAPARRVVHHLVRDLAMCCGGTMEFYIEPAHRGAEALRQALALWDARTPALLVTPLGGQPRQVEVVAGPGAQPPPPELVRDSQGERLVEPVWPRDRAILFGAGHVTRAVAPLCASVGFEIVICDDDDTGALTELVEARPPWLGRVVESFDIRDVERDLGPLGAGDYALIMTRDHAVDQAILEQLLGNLSLTYLGLIGSMGKIGRFRKRLEARGLYSEPAWARLHAPIGLDIGSETPAEIAVSVVAELIKTRRGRG